MENNKLTKEEELFCELYATGEAPFAGDAAKSYMEAFSVGERSAKKKALKLLSEPYIQEYLEELEKMAYEEARYMKRFLTENLKNIVTECSTGAYRDRRGQAISPAALRSVAVNASKALMDMYPIKQANLNKLSIDGSGDNGITFNVIIPEKPQDKNE